MNKISKEISLLNSIVCDDIRIENNHKMLLIGVYSTTIVVNVAPAIIPISLWLEFCFNTKGIIKLEFRISGEALEKPSKLSTEVDTSKIKNQSESIPLMVKIPLAIKKSGSFAIEYKEVGSKTWILARTMYIKEGIKS